MSKYTVNGEGWVSPEHVLRVHRGSFYECFKNEAEMSAWANGSGCYLSKTEIEQRYTDQQIELLQKDEGWIAGKWSECPIDQGMFVQVKFQNREIDFIGYADGWGWARAIAYRLVTNDHYIDGERIKLQEGDWVEESITNDHSEKIAKIFLKLFGRNYRDYEDGKTSECGIKRNKKLRKLTIAQVLNAENAKSEEAEDNRCSCQHYMGDECAVCSSDDHINDEPDVEWSGEGLPPVGIECEVYTSAIWQKCSTVGLDKNGLMVVRLDDSNNAYVGKGSANSFRPLRTERERVIEKAMQIYIDDLSDEEVADWVEEHIKIALGLSYDAGMLIEGGDL